MSEQQKKENKKTKKSSGPLKKLTGSAGGTFYPAPESEILALPRVKDLFNVSLGDDDFHVCLIIIFFLTI